MKVLQFHPMGKGKIDIVVLMIVCPAMMMMCIPKCVEMEEKQRVRWKCEEEKYFNENYNQDLMKNLSDWLCDLTLTNINSDDVTTVEHG